MRRILSILSAILLLTMFLPAEYAVLAQAENPPVAEPASGSVLCPPGAYPLAPDDCLPIGPSAYLTQLSRAGITLPISPLPAYPPSPDLNILDYSYFKVNPDGTSIYASLHDALNGQPAQTLQPGYLFVSYQYMEETDQGIFFQLRSGEWIRGDGGRLSVPVFQGLLFSSTPRNPFGWIRGEIRSRTAPGFSSPETGHRLYRYNMVQVFDMQEADNVDWDLIGPDEWVEDLHVSKVNPRSAPPEGVTTDRWIEVNLYEQTLAVYEKDRLIFATLVSTGVEPFWTRPGLFKIYQKKPTEVMSGSFEADRSDYYYLEDVPWTMYYDEARALHGAYWHNRFGYPLSHGCVNLSVGDSHWLFDWAHEGDYVYVYDPSGQTPTDPSLYGAGAP